MSQKVLISIVGPTAIGKTKLSIALAKHFVTDIISADSRQFYKEMKIGTAVPSKEELGEATHHFIQHKSVREKYTVGDFEREALNTLNGLFEVHNIVIMVGGSGLYVDAVTQGLDHFPKVAPEIREQLNEKFETEGIEALQNQLKQLDPDYYENVDLENPHRLIRALEVCVASNTPYSFFLNKKQTTRPFEVLTVGLFAEREIIYDRINKRVDLMMEQGLLEEVKSLVKLKSRNALKTVGYKELFHHLDGNCELEFAVQEIKKNTRRFAKRQMTWFRKNPDIIWIDHEETWIAAIAKIEKELNQ